jgi:hypothetical protein
MRKGSSPLSNDLWEAANEICWRAGHDNPEALDPGTRFDLVMRHILKNPIVKRVREASNDRTEIRTAQG